MRIVTSWLGLYQQIFLLHFIMSVLFSTFISVDHSVVVLVVYISTSTVKVCTLHSISSAKRIKQLVELRTSTHLILFYIFGFRIFLEKNKNKIEWPTNVADQSSHSFQTGKFCKYLLFIIYTSDTENPGGFIYSTSWDTQPWVLISR